MKGNCGRLEGIVGDYRELWGIRGNCGRAGIMGDKRELCVEEKCERVENYQNKKKCCVRENGEL